MRRYRNVKMYECEDMGIACPAVVEPVETTKGEDVEMWRFICTFTNLHILKFI
jgi:hypothetical protein